MKKNYFMFLLLLLFSVMGFSQTTTRYEAESAVVLNSGNYSGVGTESGGTGTVVNNISNNDWIKFPGHVFSQYDTRFDVRAACRTGSSTVGTLGAPTGTVEFRLDAVDGTLIGTATITTTSTGNWTTFQNFSAAITQTTGTHDLYLVFKTVGTYLGNMDYFEKVTNDASAVLYTLTNSVTPLNSGTIAANPASASYTAGTSVTLTATKNFGYAFSRWTDGNGTTVSTANPYTFTINANTTLVAEFQTVPTYTLSTTAQGAFGLGEFSIAPAGKDGAFSIYETGTNVTVTALENDIVKFSNWSDGSTALSKSVTINADTNVTGTFTYIPFIAGWTFKNDTYATPRVAELYSNVNNRPQLAAYHVSDDSPAPNVRLQNKGGENGFCVWNFDRGQFFYFKTSFSTVGYKNINVSSGLIGNWYGCDQWTFQYSLDGINFIDVSSLTTINTSTITSIGGVLPAEAEGKEIIYLRWFPNVNGPKHGDAADVTATILSNVMVKADENSTTWDGTAWSNGNPSASLVAIIAGTYTTTANGALTTQRLTVNSGGALTINSGTSVTIQNEVINNGGSIIVENNANLIQVNNVANTGNVVVKRNGNALSRLDYTMWSSPVAGQKLADFSPLTSQSPSRFYTYDAATNLYAAVATPTTANFSAGNGYLIRMPNTAVSYPSTATFIGTFTGVPNNGNINLSNLTANKFYAVGNPYSSTISAASFLSNNSTAGTLYFWRKTNGIANSGSAYATWTTLGGTAAGNVAPNDIVPNGTIQVGQGFIVKATSTSLQFTNAMREVAPASTQFLKIAKTEEKSCIWLNLTGSDLFSQTLIGYLDGATEGVDNGIDGKYINDSKVALTSNIDGEEYTIQGRPAFDATDVVPLNFKTDKAGEYKIAIDHTDGLFAKGQNIYLVDSVTGTETNLTKESYIFTAESGTNNDRFTLKYQSSFKTVGSPVFDENTVTVYKANGTLYVNSAGSVIVNIKVFDIQGRLIAEQKEVNAANTAIKNLKATQQLLLVQVTSDDKKVVTKKVVN